MVAVQSDGCAPIVRAFDAGERFAKPWEAAHTCATGLRVPSAVGDFMILDAVRASGGWAVSAPEDEIVTAMIQASSAEGISVCPEAATGILAIKTLRADGRIGPRDRVVLFNTGSACKYVETGSTSLPVLTDPENVDYTSLLV